MSKVIEIPKADQRKTQLSDATGAFYFSRLPREERIAKILFEILKKSGGPLECGQVEKPEDLFEIGKELAKYSVKDFAVRPGRIDG